VGVLMLVLYVSRSLKDCGDASGETRRVEIRERRSAFLDELKATIPVHSITEATAEIIARVGGEQAAKGINLPLADLIIGACALELGYAIGTDNKRDFNRIPDLQVILL
jgi:predicted nucleic acid-binding protein